MTVSQYSHYKHAFLLLFRIGNQFYIVAPLVLISSRPGHAPLDDLYSRATRIPLGPAEILSHRLRVYLSTIAVSQLQGVSRSPPNFWLYSFVNSGRNLMDIEAFLPTIERSQATGYIGVAVATIVYYDYILTFENEGTLFPRSRFIGQSLTE